MTLQQDCRLDWLSIWTINIQTDFLPLQVIEVVNNYVMCQITISKNRFQRIWIMLFYVYNIASDLQIHIALIKIGKKFLRYINWHIRQRKPYIKDYALVLLIKDNLIWNRKTQCNWSVLNEEPNSRMIFCFSGINLLLTRKC